MDVWHWHLIAYICLQIASTLLSYPKIFSTRATLRCIVQALLVRAHWNGLVTEKLPFPANHVAIGALAWVESIFIAGALVLSEHLFFYEKWRLHEEVTAYLYSQFLHSDVVHGTEHTKPLLIQYTECLFDATEFGFDLLDTSKDHVQQVYDWIDQTIDLKLGASPDDDLITLPGGACVSASELTQRGRDVKWMELTKGVELRGKAVLELGFGNMEFLKYCRQQGADRIVGVTISNVQASEAKAAGFEVILCNFWDLETHVDAEHGKFDFVLNNGALEHLLTGNMNPWLRCEKRELKTYRKFVEIVSKLMCPDAVFENTIICTGTTCSLGNPTVFCTGIPLYLSSIGNYPRERAYITAGEQCGLVCEHCKDVTLPYAVWSALVMLAHWNARGSLTRICQLAVYSFACPTWIFVQLGYGGIPIFGGWRATRTICKRTCSWLQQFIPVKRRGQYIYNTQIAQHRYIRFRKPHSTSATPPGSRR